MREPNTMQKFMGLGLAAAVIAMGAAQADEKITVKTDADGKVTIRHDAISDVYDDTYATIVVKKAPPELRNEDELMKVRPDDKAVWIPGYWRWNTASSEYEWISGVWRRQIPNETWHPGKWINTADSYVWQRGYWGSQADEKLIYVKEAPPALREETKGASPGAGYIWIAGLWKYEGDKFVWLPGSWERPASEDMTWVPTAWVKTSSGYENIPGHWDYTPDTRTYVVKVK